MQPQAEEEETEATRIDLEEEDLTLRPGADMTHMAAAAVEMTSDAMTDGEDLQVGVIDVGHRQVIGDGGMTIEDDHRLTDKNEDHL